MAEHCLCPRPRRSGRSYFESVACDLCGKLIDEDRSPGRIRAELKARALEQERSGRERVKGGLPPEGPAPTELAGKTTIEAWRKRRPGSGV